MNKGGGGRSENRKGDGARQNTEKKKNTAHAPGRCGAPARGPLGPPGPRAGPPRGPAVGGNPECSSQAPGREPGKASGGPFSRRVPASGPGRGPDRRGRGPLVPGRTRPSPREGTDERNIPATERKTPQTGLKNRNRNPHPRNGENKKQTSGRPALRGRMSPTPLGRPGCRGGPESRGTRTRPESLSHHRRSARPRPRFYKGSDDAAKTGHSTTWVGDVILFSSSAA